MIINLAIWLDLLVLTSIPSWKTSFIDTNISLRGLCVVSDTVVWASGTRGTWVKTTDGGEHWVKGRVAGAGRMDFRDIHAFDDRVAVIMSSGDTGRIYKTMDGGQSWILQYEKTAKGFFLDGFAFSRKTGIAYGDPVDGMWVLLLTWDGGSSWEEVDTRSMPPPLENEAGFAASGTGIFIRDNSVWFGTGGGAKARLYRSADWGRSWTVHETPLRSGPESGVFSLIFTDERNGIAVGGNYNEPGGRHQNCSVTSDGGVTWELVKEHGPAGYRSCVAAGAGMMITAGTNGSEWSENGREWFPLAGGGFHAVAIGRRFGWGAGKGVIKKIDLTSLKN